MRRSLILTVIGVVATVFLLASLTMDATADDPPTGRTARERSTVLDRGGDEEGESRKDEEEKQIEQRMREALSTSSDGLVEVRSLVPGGGIMVDLNGRFRQIMVATVNENGEFSVVCTSGPGSLPEKPEPSKQAPAPKPAEE
jgi:PAS domain-containing protein